jgi:hypothetical protein
MIDQTLNLSNKSVFEQLWAITNQLRQRIEERFQLNPAPSTNDLHSYSNADGNVQGSLKAFSGKEIDWLVHVLSHSEKSNFSVMRLTIWLSSHIRVPHLTFEFGMVPDIFFYIDYIPRCDLVTDLEYLKRYYEPVNETFLKLQSEPTLSMYTSKSVYIREFMSPSRLCYTSSATNEKVNLVSTLANEMLERWLTWIDEAEPVSEDARPALASRDLFIRRSSAELDPGNKLAEQMFGKKLTDKVVQGLWGGLPA